MQLSWSWCWLIGGLVLLNLSVYVLKYWKDKRARRRAQALTRELRFLQHCSDFNLSEREAEVLRLILEGLTYKAVGLKLFISEKTVDSHMQNIYDKVGVRNKFALLNKMYS